ncbi:MAG: hypothetical protein Tsb0016_08250 [Sphingomonadales bacterium]
MKIEHVSDAMLTVRDRPWLMVLFLWAVGLAALHAALTGALDSNGAPLWAMRVLVGALGLGACMLAWIAFPFQHIVFDRARYVVLHHRSRPFMGRIMALPLNDIVRAGVEKYWGESAWMERVVLETAQGRHPLEIGYCGAPRGIIVNAINDWLARGRH